MLGSPPQPTKLNDPNHAARSFERSVEEEREKEDEEKSTAKLKRG